MHANDAEMQCLLGSEAGLRVTIQSTLETEVLGCGCVSAGGGVGVCVEDERGAVDGRGGSRPAAMRSASLTLASMSRGRRCPAVLLAMFDMTYFCYG